MPFFRKKPDLISIEQVFAEKLSANKKPFPEGVHFKNGRFFVGSHADPIWVSDGDWIVSVGNNVKVPFIASIFEATYELVSEEVGSRLFSFGDAINFLKNGHAVARTGWNGKGMWLSLTPGGSISADLAKHAHPSSAIHRQAILDGTSISCDPHIDMRTVDGTIAIGWLASAADMLSADWFVVPLDGPALTKESHSVGETFGFERALELLKAGYGVYRPEWRDLVPNSHTWIVRDEAGNIEMMTKRLHEGAACEGAIRGLWVPSQESILATDWLVEGAS